MIRLNKLMMAVVMLFLLSILGCGDFSGPGSDDVKYTGMFFSVTSITPKDLDANTYDIDILQDLCTGTPPKPEPFKDSTMALVLSYAAAPSCANQACPALYLESYRVDFRSHDSHAIQLDSVSATLQSQMLPGKTLTLDGIKLVPLYLKAFYIDSGGDQNVINGNIEIEYEVKVTVKAITEFGERVEAIGYTYVLLADFDNC